MPTRILFFLAASLFPLTVSAYEQMYAKTEVGAFEIKELPAATLAFSAGENSYFDSSNGLFRPLFRFISSNDVKMTVPVEAQIAPGRMYFYIGEDGREKQLESSDQVTLVRLERRTVASYGARGGYSERNFEKAKVKLNSWLEDHRDLEAAGEARGVFWNGPFTLAPFKRFEVHIPIRKRSNLGEEN